MITLDNLKSFFKTYILQNNHYSQYKLYTYFMEYVCNSFFKDSYENIPFNRKLMVEDQIIPIEWYDNILLSNGFPKSIVNSITTKDKYIILTSLMDYNRLKGTVDQISKISYTFNEKIGVYELFLDKRINTINSKYFIFKTGESYVECTDLYVFQQIQIYDWVYPTSVDKSLARRVIRKEVINDKYLVYIDGEFEGESIENTQINYERWYFVPYEIYTHQSMENNKLKRPIDFQKIYSKVNSFLLNEEYLDEMSDTDKLVAPFKTNLLFIDYGQHRDPNQLKNFIAMIILKSYSDNKLPLYFADGTYIISFKKIYKLWFYILYKYSNTALATTIDLDKLYILFDIDNISQTITDVPDIIIDYNNIKNNDELDNFRYKYFNDLKNYPYDINISSDNLLQYFKNELTGELLTYIDNRINNNVAKNEVNFILDEIYNSILTWVQLSNESILQEHISYYMSILTKFTTNIVDFPTYKLISFLKPFHTEIVSELSDYMKVYDKFNMMTTSDKINQNIKSYRFSNITTNSYLFNKIVMRNNDEMSLLSFDNYILKYTHYSQINILSLVKKMIIIQKSQEVINDIDIIKHINNFLQIDHVNIVDIHKKLIKLMMYDNITISDIFVINESE